MPTWDEIATTLKSENYPEDEIESQRKDFLREQLSQEGYDSNSISEALGDPKPFDFKPMQEDLKNNLQGKQFGSLTEAFDYGFKTSSSSMAFKTPPGTIHNDDLPLAQSIAAGLGGVIGEAPALALGGGVAALAIASAPITVPAASAAAVITGASFASSSYFRKWLTDFYQHGGEPKTFRDYWARFSSAFLEAVKGFNVGATTSIAGAEVEAAFAAKSAISTTAKLASEVATMTSLGAAFEERMPSWNEFATNSFLVGGMHAVGKLANIYNKTGVRPSEIAKDAERDPVLKQELASKNIEIPEKYKPLADVSYTYDPVNVADRTFYISTTTGEKNLKTYLENYPEYSFSQTQGKDVSPFELGLTDNNLNKIGIDSAFQEVMSDQPVNQIPVKLKKDVKLLDLEKPLPDEIINILYENQNKQGNVEYLGPKISREEHFRVLKLGPAKDTLKLGFTPPKGGTSEQGLTNRANKAAEFTTKLIDLGYDGTIQLSPIEKYKTDTAGVSTDVTLFTDPRTGKIPRDIIEDSPVEVSKDVSVTSPKDIEAAVNKLLESDKISTSPPKNYELSDAQKRIRSRFANQESGKPPKLDNKGGEVNLGEAKEFAYNTLSKIRRKVFDSNEEFRVMRNLYKKNFGDLKPEDDPWILARLLKGEAGRQLSILKYDTIDVLTKKPNGLGLEPSLGEFKNDIQLVNDYMLARHALTLGEKGISVGVDLADAKAVVDQWKSQLEPVAKNITSFGNRNLKMLADSGVISKEFFNKKVLDYPTYVSLKRYFEDNVDFQKPGSLRALNPIKAIKGGEQLFPSLMLNMAQDAITNDGMANRNLVLQKIRDIGLQTGYVEEVPLADSTTLKSIAVKAEEISKALKDKNIDIPGEVLEPTIIWRRFNKKITEDQFVVFDNGKPTLYRTTPEIADGINNWSPGELHTLIKIAAFPAKSLQTGITIAPSFNIKNFFRDQFTATANTTVGELPITKFMDGVLAQLGNNPELIELHKEWIRNGGAGSTLNELSEKYLRNEVFKLNESNGVLDKTWNRITNVPAALKAISEIIETSPRIGEFKAVKEATGSSVEAAFRSQEITTNFTARGSSAIVRGITHMVPFGNPALQGFDNLIRTSANNPKRVAWTLSAITSLSVLTWAWNHKLSENSKDKESATTQPGYVRDLNWVIGTSEDPKTSIPFTLAKPREWGLVGSFAERFLDWAYLKKPDAFKGFFDNVAGVFGVSPIPSVILPVVEQFANKSYFRNTPIIPEAKLKLVPAEQYGPYTSEFSKAISSMIGHLPFNPEQVSISPAVLDNYIYNWSGTAGNFVVAMMDKALIASGAIPDPVKPAWGVKDYPLIGAFVARYPSLSAEPIQRFYDRFNRNEQILNSYKKAIKSNDPKLALTYLEIPSLSAQLDATKAALSNQNRVMQDISALKNLSPEEKRERLDSIIFQMIKIAEYGNKVMDKTEGYLSKALKGK